MLDLNLTKQDRHEIYKESMKFIEVGKIEALCMAINFAHFNIKRQYLLLPDIRDNFPELMSKRPKSAEKGSYWWGLEDKKIRIKVLKELIEETK